MVGGLGFDGGAFFGRVIVERVDGDVDGFGGEVASPAATETSVDDDVVTVEAPGGVEGFETVRRRAVVALGLAAPGEVFVVVGQEANVELLDPWSLAWEFSSPPGCAVDVDGIEFA